ncbi:MAG TPA: type ISP restriction/modification enzyme, partial [bacterium]|nr:type ISP restriction/modification enzyme [bacterium]
MQTLEDYSQEIAARLVRGDAREESYYHALASMVQDLAAELEYAKIDVTTLPKPTEAGNPDFRIWDGAHKIIGYIEAKNPGSDLRSIEGSEQLKRYRFTFPNVILTDFYTFRLYRDGELVDQAAIGRPYVGKKLQERPPLENVDDFTELLGKFLSHSAPRTFQAFSLAKELAKRTRFLEGIIEHELIEDGEESSRLHGFYEAFHTYLISGLTTSQFADLYAQTITYGLFAARTRVAGEQPFTRTNAADYIPRTIGILKDVFEFISYGKLPENIRWIVDDIAEILHVADIEQILTRYYEEGKGKDPVIHFYETFLTAYDPALREHRGVYYTPESVVSYIVQSVHQILKDEFGKSLGLADSSVTVLDPAGGTLTFIAEAFRVAVAEFVETYGEGDTEGFIRDHLLEHFYAFELMMAPYAIGHLKLGFILDELGYHLAEDERLKLYLTNTLELEELEQTTLPGMDSLSKESRAAGKIKKEEPVLVIMGNPPYSGHSFNDNDWIDGLLKKGYTHDNGQEDDGYYIVDGAPLGEKNPKWLQDDYVKFLRFAQWKIDQHGQGIVGMISNHSYLDNPTFRGMRESLMKSFDKIAVLDLHGNARKKETAPDGSRDENVFDIQQGVAIALLRKINKRQEVLRGDRYGVRADKNDWLEHHTISNTDWTKLQPQSPFYFFKEQDYELAEKYNKHISVNELFPLNSVGIVTARDHFTIHWTKDEVWRVINNFINRPPEEARLLFDLGNDTRDWKVELAQRDIRESGPEKSHL